MDTVIGPVFCCLDLRSRILSRAAWSVARGPSVLSGLVCGRIPEKESLPSVLTYRTRSADVQAGTHDKSIMINSDKYFLLVFILSSTP